MSIFKTTRLLALAALASFPLSGVAGDDFGLWTEISAEKNSRSSLASTLASISAPSIS